jgi:hypothetical protein
MRQYFVFAHEGRGGHLRHHESGIQSGAWRQKRRKAFAKGRVHHAFESSLADARKSAQRDAEVIEREGDGLAVKVTARNHVSIGIC